MSLFIYNVSLYTICIPDIEQILLLDRYFMDLGYEDRFVLWDKEDFIYYLSRRDVIFTVLKKEKIVGFCLSVINFDESELYKIVVDKSFRGKGLGKFMMLYHLGSLKFKGIKISFLEVSSKNELAISLYTSMGYELVNIRKNYYGTDDALVMRKFL